jgi:hypothetical protein
MKYRRILLKSLICLLVVGSARAGEFSAAAQPQLAATADGRVWLAFGRGNDVFVARSENSGKQFGEPIRVAAVPSLMVGRRRGPRIVAHGDDVTLTVMAGELFAFHSKDGGKSWAGPVSVNDAPRSAREGLDGLAVAPDGTVFATWLDLRGERTQLFGAQSTDGGATWSANQLVYRAPGGNTVCECCHPSALFTAHGDLVVMWRNALDGARDMWLAVRPSGSGVFGRATKLGNGTWPLKACPMDGGALFTDAAGVASVWQRDGAVYFAEPGKRERKIAMGKQPVATSTDLGSVAVWEQGADLWTTRLSSSQPAPKLLTRKGRFPAIVSIPGGSHVLVAYERGPDTVVMAIE